LEGDDSPLPALKTLTKLPDMWFIQVPHDLPDETFNGDGWQAEYIENRVGHWGESTDEYTRLVKNEAECRDADHLNALGDNFTALLPAFNTDAHPSTGADAC
jgi:hypothetical protein